MHYIIIIIIIVISKHAYFSSGTTTPCLPTASRSLPIYYIDMLMSLL